MNRYLCVIASILLLLLASTRAAHADAGICIAANEQGSSLKAQGEFVAARAAYLGCSSEKCPKVIREECTRLIGELDAATPTVVLVAVDAAGNDARDVRVLVDGALHSPGVDGRAFAIDPGEHEFRFESAGQPRELRAVIREGEKQRVIRVQLAEPIAPPTSQSRIASRSAQQPRAAVATRPIPTMAYVLSAAGVAALGSFTYFALSGHSQQAELERRCAPYCRLDEANAMQAKYLAADVSLAVAAASLGAATYIYVSRPAAAESGEARHVPQVLNGLQLGVRGAF